MPLVEEPELEYDGAHDLGADDGADALVGDIGMEDESFEMGSATGEAHAEEIVKILTETDVYVKYGLHQKAIDHLRRVFDLDQHNLEARERLKDILRSLHRTEETVAELVTLAKQVVHQDPARAEGYIQEALGIDPGNQEVRALARQHRLDTSSHPDVEIVDEASNPVELAEADYGYGGVAPVDDELEMEDDGFAAEFADESGVNPRPAEGPRHARPGSDLEFELYDPHAEPDAPPRERSTVTQEIAVDAVVEEFALGEAGEDELAFDDVVVPDATGTDELEVGEVERQGAVQEVEASSAPELSLDGLSYEEPSVIDVPAARTSPAAARESRGFDFDIGPAGGPGHPRDAARVARPIGDDYAAADETALSPPGFVDAAEAFGSPFDGEPVAAERPTQDTAELEGGGDVISSTAGTSLEDDLDEADFFVAQGLLDEARDILETLLSRYPSHPLILAKLADVAAMVAGGESSADFADEGSQPIDLEELERRALADRAQASRAVTGNEQRPAVMLEKPVADEDADTHFDLGLAYKEMGLHDEAIASFNKVLHVTGRAVECNMMIGLCQREQGNQAEAIQQFKNGLYVEGIRDDQKLGLYFEIGATYELLDDPGEALYFFDMVLKKDAGYRDVEQRVAALKEKQAGNGARRRKKKAVTEESIDSGYESVTVENDASHH
jgi:tetratricopeptide (TPR) repeat protein